MIKIVICYLNIPEQTRWGWCRSCNRAAPCSSCTCLNVINHLWEPLSKWNKDVLRRASPIRHTNVPLPSSQAFFGGGKNNIIDLLIWEVTQHVCNIHPIFQFSCKKLACDVFPRSPSGPFRNDVVWAPSVTRHSLQNMLIHTLIQTDAHELECKDFS